jgi:hypothetical protein
MLGDSVFNFKKSMAESGLMTALQELVKVVKSVLDNNMDLARTLGRGLANAVRVLTKVLSVVINHFEKLVVFGGAFIALKLGSTIILAAGSMIQFARGIQLAGTALALFNKIGKKNIIFAFVSAGLMAASQVDVFREKIEELARAFGLSSGDAKKVNDDLAKLKKELAESGNNSKSLADRLGMDGKKIEATYKKTIKDLSNDIVKLQLELIGYSDAEAKIIAQRGAFQRSGNLVIINKKALEDAKVNLDLLRKEVDLRKKLTEAVQKQKDAISTAKSAVESSKPATEVLKETMNALNFAYSKGEITLEQYTRAMRLVKKQYLEATEGGKIAMEAVNSLSTSISQGIADVITQSGEGLKNWKDTLRGILNSVIQQFLKVRIQAILTGQAISAMGATQGKGQGLFGALASGLNMLFGGGGGQGLSVPDLHASGGSIRANVPSIVGERGPELFMPNTGGTIKNAHDTRSIMGGGGGTTVVNQSFNISTGVAQTVRAEVMGMMPMIESQTLEAVVDAKRRGGSFADAMA